MAKARLIELQGVKTYKTYDNAVKAVEKKFGEREFNSNIIYIITTDKDGRFFPVFIGERAMQEMIHFHFNVVL